MGVTCQDSDLEKLGLPLVPRRKLLEAEAALAAFFFFFGGGAVSGRRRGHCPGPPAIGALSHQLSWGRVPLQK